MSCEKADGHLFEISSPVRVLRCVNLFGWTLECGCGSVKDKHADVDVPVWNVDVEWRTWMWSGRGRGCGCVLVAWVSYGLYGLSM